MIELWAINQYVVFFTANNPTLILDPWKISKAMIA